MKKTNEIVKVLFLTLCMVFAFATVTFATSVGVYETADGLHKIKVNDIGEILYDDTYSLTLTASDTGDTLTGKIGSNKKAVTFYELNDSTWLSYTTVAYTHNSATTYLYEYTAFHLNTFEPIIKEDGIYEVWAEDVKLNTYADLQSAVSAAKSGETVKITSDAKVTSGAYVADKSITIDGCETTLDKSAWTNSVFFVEKGATLNLENLTIDGGANGFEVDYDAVTFKDYTIPLKSDSATEDFLSNLAVIISKGNLNTSTIDISNNFIAKNGAGIYISKGTASFKDSKFNHNRASKGAAIYIGSEFEANQTEYSVENVIIDNCEFERNYAAHGAGVFIIHTENIEFYDTDFISNTITGSGYGAAIMISYNSHKKNGVTYNSSGHANGLDYTQVKVDNCLFDGNWAGNDGYAIQNYDAELKITNSIFRKNVGVHQSGSVATISIYVWRQDDYAKQIIDNCLFEENEGPISCIGDHGTNVEINIKNSEFKGNKGLSTIYYLIGCTTIENTTFEDEDVTKAVLLFEPCDTKEYYEAAGLNTSYADFENVTFLNTPSGVPDILFRTYYSDPDYVKTDAIFNGDNTANISLKDNNMVTINDNYSGDIIIDYKTEASKVVVSDIENLSGKVINNTLCIEYPDGESIQIKQIPPEDGKKASSYYIQELLGIEKEGYILALYTDEEQTSKWDHIVVKGTDLYASWEEHIHDFSGGYIIENNKIVKACECGYSEGYLAMEIPENLMYDGNEKSVTIVNTLGVSETEYTLEYEVEDNESWQSVEVPVNAGKYKARVTLSENAMLEAEYMISKAEIEGPLENLKQKEGSVIQVTHPIISKVTDGTVIIEYKSSDDSDDEYDEKLPRKKGEYTVRLTITGDSNINDANIEGTLIIEAKASQKSNGSGATVVRYKITVECTEGGKVLPNVARVARGKDQTFEIIPEEGYEVVEVLVDDELVENLNVYTFENVKEKHTLKVKFGKIEEDISVWENPFVDVTEDDWYYESVKYTNGKGLFNGISNKKFAADLSTTRAMIVTVLYRAEGEPATNRSIPFADVNMGMYYANAVIWAKQNNIVNGVDENNFAPDENITRQQLIAILYRYAMYKGFDVSVGEETNILSYDDALDISEYAIPAMQWGCGAGIISGRTTSTLTPNGTATRAEVATMLMRFFK